VICRSQSEASCGNPGIWGRTPMVKVWASLCTTWDTSEDTWRYKATGRLKIFAPSNIFILYLVWTLISKLEVLHTILMNISPLHIGWCFIPFYALRLMTSTWDSTAVRYSRCLITVTAGSEHGIRPQRRDERWSALLFINHCLHHKNIKKDDKLSNILCYVPISWAKFLIGATRYKIKKSMKEFY